MTVYGPMQTPSATVAEFDTRMYAEREGFSFWQEEICRYLSPSVTERANHSSTFAASLRRVAIGRVAACDISFSPMLNFRDARCQRKMPDDDVYVAVMKEGTGQLHQYGRSAVLAPGDVVLYDSICPFEWRFGESSRMLVARISRRQASARLMDIDTMAARTVQAGHPSASIIGNTTADIMRLAECLDPGSATRLGDALADLIASSLEACLRPPATRPALESVLERSKNFLLDNLEDPDIGLDHLTRQVGVSVKTLCRAFALEGTTPIRWLWGQRLERAARMLQDGRSEQVGQIAMLCGFSDFSHFSRSFKKAYGVQPRALKSSGADIIF